MDQRIFTLFQKQDWQKISLELAKHTALKVRRLYWRTPCEEILPEGETIKSLVSKAVEKVLSGERKWNPDKNPDLLKYLKSVLDSLISHLATSIDNQLLQRFQVTNDGQDKQDLLTRADTPYATELGKTPEELMLEKEKAERDNKILSELIDVISDDEELSILWNCFEKGIVKADEIAKETGFDVSHVYQLRRKLDRRAATLGEKLGLKKNKNREE